MLTYYRICLQKLRCRRESGGIFSSVFAIQLNSTSLETSFMKSGIYYSDYLQLEKILGAQELESSKVGSPAHDEMLFIITHQAYELWFKQIVFELESVIDVFDDPQVEDKKMATAIHRLERIKQIQKVLIQQIDVIETMTPLDFLEFRDLLTPASGFQSIQFKQIEIMLGIKRKNRINADKEFFPVSYTHLTLPTICSV